MKKGLTLILVCLVLLSMLGGCSNDAKDESSSEYIFLDPAPSSSSSSGSATKDDNEKSAGEATAPSNSAKESQVPSEAAVDVDLTILSSTMVYAEVYNIMIEPDAYVGKVIRMRGEYVAYHDEETDVYYHAVIISDATACCAQGLEFIWTGEHNYPEDYPANETEIEITGVFESFEENGYTWYRIRTNSVETK